jgi:signal transduction histidine kinase
VTEALINTAKYARASHVSVELPERDGVLHFSVRDDGVDGADPCRGSYLKGKRDRVEALGGSIDARSPAGEGTLAVATIPVLPR